MKKILFVCLLVSIGCGSYRPYHPGRPFPAASSPMTPPGMSRLGGGPATLMNDPVMTKLFVNNVTVRGRAGKTIITRITVDGIEVSPFAQHGFSVVEGLPYGWTKSYRFLGQMEEYPELVPYVAEVWSMVHGPGRTVRKGTFLFCVRTEVDRLNERIIFEEAIKIPCAPAPVVSQEYAVDEETAEE